MLKSIKASVAKIWKKVPDTVRFSALVFFILLPLWVLISTISGRFAKPDFGEGLLIETFGMLLDIVVIVIVIQWWIEKREEKRRIERWQEEIDDYRDWESEEATHRIVGLVKRLNKNGVRKINLEGCRLEKARLSGANLQGANLMGANLQGTYLREANLKDGLCCMNRKHGHLSL